MKQLSLIFGIALILFACTSNNKEQQNDIDNIDLMDPIEIVVDSVAPTPEISANNDLPSQNENANTPSSTQKEEYKKGYEFGKYMGYFDGRDGSDYNPYLPVGPNVSAFTWEYRSGYCAGYSDGYAEGEEIANKSTYIIVEDYEDEDYEDYIEIDDY